jgi:hypothetical protein
MTDTATTTQYLSLTALRERGWTSTMIAALLGEPDRLKRNPRYPTAAPMKLYATERVEHVQRTCEWHERFASAQRRRKSASKGIETKTAALLREVDDVVIAVPRMSLGQLLRLSLKSWETHKHARGHYDADGSTAPPHVRERWARNFLRHEMTGYDQHLRVLYGRVGTGQAYDALNQKVHDAIDEAYPNLFQECEAAVGAILARSIRR